MSKLKTARKFNNCTISDFINKLSNESWDMVFNSEDIYYMFNSFLNDYLRIFNSSFPLQTVMVKNNLTERGVVQIKLHFYILHYRLHSWDIK